MLCADADGDGQNRNARCASALATAMNHALTKDELTILNPACEKVDEDE